MKRTLAVIAGVALLWAGPLRADYTDEGSFLGALGANPYYLNDFNDLTTYEGLGLSRSYAGNGFGYTITTVPAPTGAPGLWAVLPGGGSGGAISTVDTTSDLLASLTSGNVRAVGGRFFLTSDGPPGLYQAGEVVVTLSDGTSVTLHPPGVTNFWGYISGGPVITSVRVGSGAVPGYPTMDHFYVGAVVPEPAVLWSNAVALLGIGAGAWWHRRRTA